ncbi:MAG TPA: hypothetical protein VH352_03820 [Pseudonocardiaceae bacterium]|nr:hypothetical protein [Pseudonocardiaceae bacterium]
MDEPRGALPASVYRRRRIVATAGSAIGALLFVWAIGALLGGNDAPSVKGTANAANLRAGGVHLATTAPASNPPATGTITVHGSATSSPSTSPSLSTHPTSTPTATTTTAPPPPPGPPQPCPDSVLRVTVTATQPSYPVGQRPVLTLHITNAGQVACVRDVSRQFRSIQVMAGTVRLWSSGDCYSLATNEIRTLQPNQSLTYGVAWAGRTSAVGCPANRTTVPAGQYQLVGHLGAIAGPPTTLTLTRAQ